MSTRVDSWIKDLRNQPCKERAAQGGRAASGPNDVSAFARFAGAAGKEGDGTLSQLLACCRALEGQLRSLQAEHAELRQETFAVVRYLDRSGVLPSQELEKELQDVVTSQAANGAARAFPTKAGGQRGSGCEPPQVQDAQPAPSHTPTSAHSRRGSALQAQAPKRDWDVRRSPSPRGVRGRSVDALHQRAVSSPRVTDRGRSASARRTAVERVGNRQRSRSARSLEEGNDCTPDGELPDGGPGAPDIHATLAPLLEAAVGTPEQIRLMRVLQEQLRSSQEPPNTWSGPGTPLNAAVRVGRSEVVRLLLRSRACPNERDHKGVSALHLAVFEGNADMVQMLLTARGDVDACDRHGQTPLFFAPSRDICKLLVDRRADATLLNRKSQTALHLAGRAGLYEVLACLSTRVSKQVSELKDVHGVTARDYLQQLSAPQQASMQAMCRGGSKRSAMGTPTKDHGLTQPKRILGRSGAGHGVKSKTFSEFGASHGRDEHLSHQQLAARHLSSTHTGVSAHQDATDDEQLFDSARGGAPHDHSMRSSLDAMAKTPQFDMSKNVEHYYLSNGSGSERGLSGPGSPESPAVPLEAMYGGLDSRARGPERELVRAAVGKTALEAAAAVATAAMATVAELDILSEPLQQAAVPAAATVAELYSTAVPLEPLAGTDVTDAGGALPGQPLGAEPDAEVGGVRTELEEEELAGFQEEELAMEDPPMEEEWDADEAVEADAEEPCQDPEGELVTARSTLTMLADQLDDVF